jgi:CMP-N-acetylneuraminic acid synthetase
LQPESTPHEPLVTVYVTNHNYGRYIKQAIDSVLAQTFLDFELIVIDDGSTDDSRQVIGEYDGRAHVRVILQENKGLNATNNIAISAARGQYVMRLDADDFLDPHALLVMARTLDTHPHVAMVFPDYYYVDIAGRVTGQERRHDFKTEVSLLDQPAHGACSMIRRECLLEVQAYSEGYRCQDGYDLWLKIIDRYQVLNINLPLFYYRRHGNNLTDDHNLILSTRAEILRRHVDRAQRPSLNTVAVIAVRGPAYDPYCLSRSELAGKALIQWTADAALSARGVDEVIVTTPDRALLDWLSTTYGERLTLHQRQPAQAMENMPYDAAVIEALRERRTVAEPDALLLLGVDCPLRSSLFMEKAINTMRVFEVDLVLGVIPENDIFYQHVGSGLRPVGNNAMANKMRFEREYLYRQAGGALLVRRSHYEQHTTDLFSGRIGHVVLTREAATPVRSPLDLRIMEAIIEHKSSPVPN